MKKTVAILFIVLTISCQPSKDNIVGHQLESTGKALKIRYSGEGDVVQFKMFEGFNKVLTKNSSGVFEGLLEIQNLDDAIFSYDIVVHKKDSLRSMIKVEYLPESEEERHFLWVGKNRNISFSKANNLKGVIINKEINSLFLEESRSLTVYNPKEISDETPIIYLTDGSAVLNYAPYVDSLISEKRIMPIILVGVHSSQTNRYQEYVDNGIKNDLFNKHEEFFYNEVLVEIEREMPNWKGKRFIYGFSNGAAFCMHAGINHPEIFEEIVAFSTADYISEFIRPIEFKFQNYPKFYMGAGRYEESIFRDNIEFVPKLETECINVEFKEFVSGHDYNVWKFEFLEYLEKRFHK